MLEPALKKPKRNGNETNKNESTSFSPEDTLIEFKKSLKDMYVTIDEIVKLCKGRNNDDTTAMEEDEAGSTLANKSDVDMVHTHIHNGTMSLLEMKHVQRSLCLHYEKEKKQVMEESRKSVEQATLAYENVLYQKQHLQQQIQACRGSNEDSIGDSSLVIMAKQETDSIAVNKNNSDNNDADNSDVTQTFDEIVDTFLAPETEAKEKFSHRDPSQYDYIRKKLREELIMRQSSVKKLHEARKELQLCTKNYENQKKFMDGLPKHVKLLQQKLIQPLEQYFQSTEDDKLQKIETPTSQHKDRMEQAKKLSAPIYTIFVQLSSFLKVHAADNETYQGITLNVVHKAVSSKENDNILMSDGWLMSEENVLQLQIPFPSIIIGPNSKASSHNNQDNNKLIIEFAYLAKLNLVTAKTIDKSFGKNKLRTFLPSLFEGDNGTNLPTLVYHFIDNNDELIQKLQSKLTFSTDNDLDEVSGIPFQWCQNMAGLVQYHEFSDAPGLNKRNDIIASKSTILVMKRLVQRLRTDVTLNSLLQYLEKFNSKKMVVPTHSSLTVIPLSPVKIRVSSWEKLNHSLNMDMPLSFLQHKHHYQYYCATIKHKGNNKKISILYAFVAINKWRYPAQPPLWNLVEGGSGDGEDLATKVQPRFNWGNQFGSQSSLHYNGDPLTTAKHNDCTSKPPLFNPILGHLEARVNADFTELLDQNVEESYDWILVHQLNEIVQCWDQYLSSMTSDGSLNTNEKKMSQIVKSRCKESQNQNIVQNSGFRLFSKGL